MTIVLAIFLSATLHQQPARPESGTSFYLRYLKAVVAAKSMDALEPFWSTLLVDSYNVEAGPARPQTVRPMTEIEQSLSQVHVLKETPTPDGATLSLEAIGPDKKPMAGTVDLVKEKGAWKLDQPEAWKPKD